MMLENIRWMVKAQAGCVMEELGYTKEDIHLAFRVLGGDWRFFLQRTKARLQDKGEVERMQLWIMRKIWWMFCASITFGILYLLWVFIGWQIPTAIILVTLIKWIRDFIIAWRMIE
jgi:hypothetical protein